MNDTEKMPLLGLSLDELRELAVGEGLPKYAGAQMCQWIYQRRARSIDEMTNLSKAARQRLSEKYCIGLRPPKARAASADGTVKYLFDGAGSRDVEAVYIPDRDRATLCVSSQAGCKMGCVFCMTGRQGFHGNLSAADILNQVMSVEGSEGLTNIVFMGMGEPLDNLPAVEKAIEALTAKWGFGWSPKRITVSTVGKMRELKQLVERTKVNIAVSVHTPLAEQRLGLMPAEKAYPVRQVMEMLRDYDFAHQRRLSVEYIMWGGVNDSLRHAEALARLIKGTSARVNIIPFHAIPGSDMRPATQQAMEAFRDRLNDMGVTATIRASRGLDIDAACGMLAGKERAAATKTEE